MKMFKIQVLLAIVLCGDAAAMQSVSSQAARAARNVVIRQKDKLQSIAKVRSRFYSKKQSFDEDNLNALDKVKEEGSSWGDWFRSLFSTKENEEAEVGKIDNSERMQVKMLMAVRLRRDVPFYATDSESLEFLKKEYHKWVESGETWEEWQTQFLEDLDLFSNKKLREEYKKQLAEALVDHRIKTEKKYRLGVMHKYDLLGLYEKKVEDYEIPEDAFQEWIEGGCKPLEAVDYIDENGQRVTVSH